MTPEVTIGLPVFNGGEMLSEAIESILSQDFENFQLIISDNHSTDQTEETCLKYAKTDKKIKYYRLDENIGAEANFLRVLGLADSPYYMWATYDDLHEPAFITKCLERIKSDPSIALVYPRSKVIQNNQYNLRTQLMEPEHIYVADDFICADQDDGVERFRHLIWEIGPCNMFYGLHRTDMIKKNNSWNKTPLFGDNLILAEIALLSGKIIQIDDVLYTRRLTKNYQKSLGDRYADLFLHRTNEDGITLPYCKFTYTNFELVKNLEIGSTERYFLMNDIMKCFKTRFGNHMKYEIDRAIELIDKGYFYCTWNKKQSLNWNEIDLKMIDYLHINILLQHLREALFIYPEITALKNIHKICLDKISDFKGIQI